MKNNNSEFLEYKNLGSAYIHRVWLKINLDREMRGVYNKLYQMLWGLCTNVLLLLSHNV